MPRERTKTLKCPYDGCDYVPKPSAISEEMSINSHISNCHLPRVHVWYAGNKIIVHRDATSNTFSCPCGEYSISTASSFQRHIKNVHGNMSKTISAPQASKPAVTPKAGRDEMYRVVDPAKSTSVRASASTSVSTSSKHAASVASKPVARPPPTSASTAGPSNSRKVPVSSKRKVEEPTPGPSKVRRVENARSVSASKAVASSSKTITHISAPKPLFSSAPLKTKTRTSATISSSSASTSTLKKQPEAAPPLKAPAPNTRPITFTKTNEKKTRTGGNASSVPAKASAATAPTPAKKTAPKPRPVVKPGTLAHASAHAKTQTQAVAAQPSPKSGKHLRPTVAAGVAASSASSGYSTSTHGSSSSSSALSSPRASATPAPAPAPAPPPFTPWGSSMGLNMHRKCSKCGAWVDPYRTSGMCTRCDLIALYDNMKKNGTLPAPSAAPAPAPSANGNGNGNGGAAEARPRKQRVSKQMRQREFERWFARWTAAHRARRAARRPRPDAAEEEEEEEEGEEGEDGDKDKTDWWRVETTRKQGGVCYPTPEAFFAALGDALARHRESAAKDKDKDKVKKKGKGKGKEKAKAKGGVLTFFGGYSIVAQPRIPAMVRLDKVVARMAELGFRLDSALQGYVKFQYKSAGGTMDEVYKYPCTCGGTPPPVAANEMRHAHRIPDEKYAGEVCGGTIMLMVGEDNALLAYGIPGQRIAVDIVH